MKPILSHEKRLAQQVRVPHQEHQSKYRQYIKDVVSYTIGPVISVKTFLICLWSHSPVLNRIYHSMSYLN